MARPKKLESEKRKNKIIIYLTDEENERVRVIADGRDLAKCGREALFEWMDNQERTKKEEF